MHPTLVSLLFKRPLGRGIENEGACILGTLRAKLLFRVALLLLSAGYYSTYELVDLFFASVVALEGSVLRHAAFG